MTKASTDSTSVIQRCFQIVPSTNHLTMRAATSEGVEKKNGGRSFTPPIGTVVSSCQSATATTATSSCRIRRFRRDMIYVPDAARRPRTGHELVLLLREDADEAGRLLDLAFERLDHLVAGHARLQRVRLEVSGHQREHVVMHRAGRRARAEIVRQPHQTLAADKFLGL